MIRVYKSGEEFWNENREMLMREAEKTVFFKGNSALLQITDKSDYAVRCSSSGTLLALHLSPYALLLYGDTGEAGELADYLYREGCDLSSFMCEDELGTAFQEALEKNGCLCTLRVSMMFMKCGKISGPSSAEVDCANEKDVDEICELMNSFFADCGLPDRAERKAVVEKIAGYRVIRKEGRIAAMASSVAMEGGYECISGVYTCPAWRGQGLARKLVNSLKNEILARGKTASLYVDTANPVSSHLYASLGFQNVYRQNTYSVQR